MRPKSKLNNNYPIHIIWMALAITSLPVPVSPDKSAGLFDGAMRPRCWKTTASLEISTFHTPSGV